MIFSRLFKPRWPLGKTGHRPQPSPADPARRQQMLEHSDPGTRRAALAQFTDLDLLHSLSLDDPDAGVREYALARFRKVLSGQLDDAPPLADRLALLDRSDPLPAGLAEHLARHANEPELRLAVVQRLANEPLCADLAINDPIARIRAAALERVQDPKLLDEIARRSRNRDKHVSRLARERHQAVADKQARKAELEQLCAALEALRWDGETGPDTRRFVQLEQRWRPLAEHATLEQRQQFQQVGDEFARQFKASAAARATRNTLCQQLDELLGGLRAATAIEPATAVTSLRETQAAWTQLSPPDDPDSRRQQRRFDQLVELVEQQLGGLEQDRRQAGKRAALLGEAERLLQRSGQVLDSELSDLDRRWRQLPQPESPTLRSELQSRFEQLRGKLHQRLNLQVERKAEELAALDAALTALEQHLDAGELQPAIERQQQAEHQLAENIGLSRRQVTDLSQRLQTCMPRLAQLRDWRRWGTNRSRETLIETVERLSDSILPAAELAQQVRAARAAWKEMDGTAGGAPRALWKRFDQACERAYAPVRAEQQARAEQRQQNLLQRQALCAELEQLAAAIETADPPDWSDLSRKLPRFQQRWRQLGPVERGRRKTDDRRFQTALGALQTLLQPHLEHDLAQRQALIEQARALAEVEDTREAIAAIKQLQADWQPRVLASRREEQALWKAFRAACDAVFERHQTRRQGLIEQRRQQLDQARILCDEIEALASASDDPTAADTRFQMLCAQWEALGPLPKADRQSAEQRFHGACRHFEQTRLDRKHRAAREHLVRLAAYAALCDRAEALLTGDPDPALLADLDAAWAQASAPDDALMTTLRQRFRQARQALDGTPAERQTLLDQLRQSLATKQALCLRLEIAAKVDTPEEFARERMALQVERLSESLGERLNNDGGDVAGDGSLVLLREWYALPSPPDASHASMVQRFERVRAALDQPDR